MSKLSLALAGAASILFSTAGSAAIIPTLTGNAPTFDAIAGNWIWTYEGTVASDQGLTAGDRLVIYDFAGYVANSIFEPFGSVTASVELLSPPENAILPFVAQSDDPNLFNLVFTYTGDPLNMSATPPDSCCTELTFAGIGARSVYGGITVDGFTGDATMNANAGAAAGRPGVNAGSVAVPAVPEPSTWAMMLFGFGAVGVALRRRRPRPMLQIG